MTVLELLNSTEFEKHHTAARRGYVSRKENADGTKGVVEVYSGRFGRGYSLITPRYDTTSYVYVSYYIAKESHAE